MPGLTGPDLTGPDLIGPAGHSAAGSFLVRLLRLDPRAVVRLRPVRDAPVRDEPVRNAPVRDGPVRDAPVRDELVRDAPDVAGSELWVMLPFGVLGVRTLPVPAESDITVSAAALLATLRDRAAPRPHRRDEEWRWPLPGSRGDAVERVPAQEVARVAAAASRTLREATEHGLAGRAVGERVMRDALLDHIPIVVTGYHGERVEVPQRMVQAVIRLGMLDETSEDPSGSVTFGDKLVTVRRAGGWIGLDASRGCAWYRPSSPLRMT